MSEPTRSDADRPTGEDPLPAETAEDLFEHAPCGYLSSRPGGLLVRVNETFLAWTGYRREELVGRRRFQDLLTPGGRIFHETHYAPLLDLQGAVREIAVELVRADGSRLPALVNAVLRRDEAGRPLLVRTTVFNATDRQRYERELLHARRHAERSEQRVRTLQAATAALAATSSVADVAAALHDAVGTVVETATATVWLAQDEDETLVAVAGPAGVTGTRLAVTSGRPEVEALRRRDPVVRADADGGDPGGTVVVLPLVAADRATGVLACRLPAGCADDDRALLLTVATQAAQALERARLHEQTAEAGRRAAFLAATSRALDDVPGFAGRAQRLVDRLVPALADAAELTLPAEEGGRRVAGAGPTDAVAPAGAAARRSFALRAHGRVLGTLTLARPDRAFLPDEVAFLTEVAERAALTLENARLYEQERDVAHTLQRSLLAREPLEDPRVRVATAYRPAVETLEVGGDWHDAFPIDGDTVGIAVGDVVGRGVHAATAMGQLRSAVRALAGARLGPAGILVTLDAFVEHVPAARMATLAYAEVSLPDGRVRFACAGHPPPLLVEQGDEPRLLWDGRSAPLGAYSGEPQRPEAEVGLGRGARLLLYTDGLVERRGRTLDVGLRRLADAIGRRRAAPLDRLVEGLAADLLVDDHGRDDVCLLCLAFGAPARFDCEVRADPLQLRPLRDDLRGWLADRDVDGQDRVALVTACSEAVANAIEHAYGCDGERLVRVGGMVRDGLVELSVSDVGAWRPPGRSRDRGRGLVLMERLMDEVVVDRQGGTTVALRRRLRGTGPR